MCSVKLEEAWKKIRKKQEREEGGPYSIPWNRAEQLSLSPTLDTLKTGFHEPDRGPECEGQIWGGVGGGEVGSGVASEGALNGIKDGAI